MHRTFAQAYNYGITPIPEEEYLQQLGFDYTYDKTVLDDLKVDALLCRQCISRDVWLTGNVNKGGHDDVDMELT